MEVFQTKVSTSSEAYKQNAEVQKSHLEKLNQSLEKFASAEEKSTFLVIMNEEKFRSVKELK